MRIAAHLGVKDEVELIEGAITSLRAIGVDDIIAVDAYSTDGTAEILENHRVEEGFRLIQMSDVEPDGAEKKWLQRNLELVQAVGADWVIFLDADERWIPASGSLKRCSALAESDLVSVDRFNVPLGPDGPYLPADLEPRAYDEILLFNQKIPNFQAHLERNPGTPWIRGVPVPKFMVRPERVAALSDGMHDARARDGDSLRRSKADDLLIAHLPFTSKRRFRRKIHNIRKLMAVHDAYFTAGLAWQWRRWQNMSEDGRADEEFDRQVTSVSALAQLRTAGVVKSAAEIFAERARAPTGAPA
jgi:glycosyltransferase involved in cell wall biosynthesis